MTYQGLYHPPLKHNFVNLAMMVDLMTLNCWPRVGCISVSARHCPTSFDCGAVNGT